MTLANRLDLPTVRDYISPMNWLTSVVRPKIRSLLKRETPENMWIKCPETGQLVFYKDVEANQFVIPSSNYHMRMGATARLKSMFDGEIWFDIGVPDVPVDPLKFRDERRYTDRLKDARTKTGMNDAVKLGFGKLDGLPVVIGVQDFDFMGGSLGMAAGEAIIKGLETAAQKGTPFIMFAASGGARMHEGILALMQLPRTTVAVEILREATKPYIVVLTNPTTGGVTASYAMLGDVHIAEPGALIGFAGPRVIEQTIREKLPEGFQRAEYLKEHGLVDLVVHRHELKPTLARLCRVLCKAPAREACPRPSPPKPCRRPPLRRNNAAHHDRRRFDSGAAARAAPQAHRPVARPHAPRAGAARQSGKARAAGHPCGGHQRQGFDHRVPARHAGGGRTERARLHLAQPGAGQRALPARIAGRRPACNGPCACRGAHRMRGRERRFTDHAVRDRDGGGLRAVRAASRRLPAARSRPRRAARRHQCG